VSAAVEGKSRALWQSRMPRLLVVGAKSKTAEAVLRALRARSRGDWEVLGVSHRPGEPREIYGYPVQVVPGYHRRHLRNICLWWEPELILNTAAVTDVDRCERERQHAWWVNVALVEVLVGVCRVLGSYLVQLSTDYIFDGANGPYEEHARPCPVNYYGKTKLAAENVCQSSGISVAILRTTLIFGTPAPWCSDILGWLRQRLEGEGPIPVAADLYTNPILVEDLAQAIVCLLQERPTGVFHIGGRSWVSRYEFARAVFDAFGYPQERLQPVPAQQLYAGRAQRPLRAGLKWEHFAQRWGIVPHSLAEALEFLRQRGYSAGARTE